MKRLRTPDEVDVAGWDVLACAIVKMAYMDYQLADKSLKKTIRNHDKFSKQAYTERVNMAIRTKREVIRFFRSSWYSMLCSIDPERIIEKLQEEEELQDDKA